MKLIKEEILTGHGKLICKKCNKIIAQCRCIDHGKLIKKTTCKECVKE